MSDIFFNINEGEYKERERPRKPVQKCGGCDHAIIHNPDPPNFCFFCGAEYASVFAKAKLVYEGDLSNVNKKNAAIYARFKSDAIEYCGLTGHKNALAAFDYANGNSDNKSDLVNTLEELAELML